jgi:hypothetical protein
MLGLGLGLSLGGNYIVTFNLVTGVTTLETRGAAGDGATDDTAQIADVGTDFGAGDTGSQVLALGARTYLTTGMAIGSPWPMGLSVYGQGPKSVFKTTTNAPCILMADGDASDRAKATTFSGISFLGDGKATGKTSQDGLRVGWGVPGLDGAARVFAQNLYAKDMGGIGFILAYTDLLGIGPVSVGCRAESCYIGMAGLEGEAHGFSANDCTTGLRVLGNFNMLGGQLEDNDVAYDLIAGGNDGHGNCVGVSFTHNAIAIQLGATTNGQYFTGCRLFDGDVVIATGNDKFHTFNACLIAGTDYDLFGKTRWLNCTFGQAYYNSSDFTDGENEFVNPLGEDGTVPSWIGQQHHCQVSYASNADKTLTSQQSWAEVVEVAAGSESATVNLFNTRTPSRGQRLQYVINRTAQSVKYYFASGTGITIPTLKTAIVGVSNDGANLSVFALLDNNASTVARP